MNRVDCNVVIAGMDPYRPGRGITRVDQLAALQAANESARSRSGRLVLVSGEPGAGKSTLVTEFTAGIEPDDVYVGYCDPLSAPRTAGPLVDIAARLSAPLAGLLVAGERAGLFDAALTAMANGPRTRVIVFEDIHWADELTLELLGFLARRIASLPVLLIATYRDDQIAGGHPTRRLLGSIATAAAVATVPVPPFSVAEVSTLAEGSGLDPAELHARTGGNAFFVTELLAAPHAAVPTRVADAIAARAATLSPAGRSALVAAAVVGSRAGADVLLGIRGVEPAAIEECVRVGLLRAAGTTYRFPHELTRQAVLADTSAFELRHLHADALEALRIADPCALSRLAEHAERAEDAAAVLEYAPQAAEQAAVLGSHREAAAQLRRALRFGSDEPDEVRAELLAALSYQLFLMGELAEAFDCRRQAFGLRPSPDTAAAAGDLRWMSRLAWYRGNRTDAESYAQRAIDLLECDGACAELGMAYSNQSQLLMLAGRYAESVELGERALAIAAEVDHIETRVHALNNVGTSKVRLGQSDGVAILESSLDLALQHGLDDHVARAYVNLADGVNLHDGSDVERHLAAGRAYCESRQLTLQWAYLEAAWARHQLNRGEWDEAERTSRSLLDQSTNPSQRFEATLPLLLVRIRRGEPHKRLLDEAGSLAKLLTEPQRLLPVVFARAEAAWLAGTLPELRDELARHVAATQCREDVWRAAELSYWLHRADAEGVPAVHGESPFATQLNERPRVAAARWQALDRPYEAAVALLDGGADDVRESLATFVRIGAEPAVRLARRRLRDLGVSVIPRGPRRSTACHPYGLTSRENEVLHLLTEALTNHEIAARLVVSERTVDHHVSALLGKLQVRSRSAAAALARSWAQHGRTPCTA